MNLLGISGSLRQASFNTALLHAAQELAPPGVNISIHRLHELPLFDQDVEEQGDPPAVTALKEAIDAADGLLLACPEYNGGISGVLKNAVDWPRASARPARFPCSAARWYALSAQARASPVRCAPRISCDWYCAGPVPAPSPRATCWCSRRIPRLSMDG
jgi:NAD(P)H-dependent FMN reductase